MLFTLFSLWPLPPLKVGATLWVEGPTPRWPKGRLPDGQGTVYQTVKGPSPVGSPRPQRWPPAPRAEATWPPAPRAEATPSNPTGLALGQGRRRAQRRSQSSSVARRLSSAARRLSSAARPPSGPTLLGRSQPPAGPSQPPAGPSQPPAGPGHNLNRRRFLNM